jgi:serine protease AprX
MNTQKIHTFRRFASLALLLALLAGLLAAPTSASTPAATQSYIVQGADLEQVAAAVERYGGSITSRLDIINGLTADLPAEVLDELRADPAIQSVTPNGVVEASGPKQRKPKNPATDYPDNIGADLVWQEGTIGKGVTVAIVDTGLGWHPGLIKNTDGKVIPRIIGWKDFVDKKRIPWDPNGHGTHVAGIIANTERGSDLEWNGVAPGVNLVGVRVLNEEGYGTYEKVIQGIQWVVQHKNEFKIRVLNLSIVSPVQSPYWADPLNQAVTKAWASGLTVVVAAGNGGSDPMSIGVPANNPYVITVGAFTDNFTPEDWNDDYITPFSAAGPTLDGFVKPDVVAPGAHMVSTMLPWTYVVRHHEANKVSDTYFEMAGTSQSAGVVSGVAALILSKHPELSPDQVKHRIMATAFPWVDPETTNALYSIWQQGAGRVNAPDAVLDEIEGSANVDMDIQADLAGTQHYEGYSYYDETTQTFRLRGDFNDWGGNYWVWDGRYGIWSGGYGVWADRYGIWSGRYGIWSGGYGAWAGRYGIWSGRYGIWSGRYGIWSGGYGIWSGGYGVWTGSVPWADTAYAQEQFVNDFLAGKGPSAKTTTSFIRWVDEP